MPEALKAAGVSQQAAAAELPATWSPGQRNCVDRSGCIKLHSKNPQEYQINVLVFTVGDETMQLLSLMSKGNEKVFREKNMLDSCLMIDRFCF